MRFHLVIFILGSCWMLAGRAEGQFCDQRLNGGEMMCCRGRNSSCFTTINHSGKALRHNKKNVCYCDEYCRMTKDCCDDFEETFKICQGTKDCILSPWAPWSACSKACGLGVQSRKRIVLYYPRNGGKSCANLKEERGCALHKCTKDHGIAQILPAVYRRLPFGSYKYENILPAPKFLDAEYFRKRSRKSYCVEFKLISKHPYCRGTWADKMTRSRPICVECQPEVMDKYGHCQGQGKEKFISQWMAVDKFACQGVWVRKGSAIRHCKCNKKSYTNFIFI